MSAIKLTTAKEVYTRNNVQMLLNDNNTFLDVKLKERIQRRVNRCLEDMKYFYKASNPLAHCLIENYSEKFQNQKVLNRRLSEVVKLGDLEEVKYLQTKGANVKAIGNILHKTVANSVSKNALIDYLINECQIDVNTIALHEKTKITALHAAFFHKCFENAKYLIEKHGASLNIPSGRSNVTPLYFAAWKCSFEQTQYLVERCDADITVVDVNGDSILNPADDNHDERVLGYLGNKLKDLEKKDGPIAGEGKPFNADNLEKRTSNKVYKMALPILGGIVVFAIYKFGMPYVRSLYGVQ